MVASDKSLSVPRKLNDVEVYQRKMKKSGVCGGNGGCDGKGGKGDSVRSGALRTSTRREHDGCMKAQQRSAQWILRKGGRSFE